MFNSILSVNEIREMSQKELLDIVFTLDLNSIAKNHIERVISAKDVIYDIHVEEWLEWCQKNDKVKVYECPVPPGILPQGFSGILHDIKVSGGYKGGHGPDDKIYNNDADIRDKVARGNTVLELINPDGKTTNDMVVFALKKFTGGMGDEDEDQPENDQVWQRYFSKPLEQVTKVVCMMKENGEAAHVSIRRIDNTFYFIVGSKNVHLLFNSKEHLDLYTDSRYMVARSVANAWLDQVQAMNSAHLDILLNFMDQTKLTAVFEILQPSYQHVVDLSYLQKPLLKFLAFTNRYSSRSESETQESLSALPPDVGIDFAKCVGLETARYEIISASESEARMASVRRGYGYEGEVLYFLDKDQATVGLLKKKTSWYVLCRAIREKVANSLSAFKKNPAEFSTQLSRSHKAKINKRIDEIQRWLDLTEEETIKWKLLGENFHDWLVLRFRREIKNLENISVRGNFPQIWKEFLTETSTGDNISVGDIEIANSEKPSEDTEETLFVLENPRMSSPRAKIEPTITKIRPYIAICIIRNLDLFGKNLKKVVTSMNKIHMRQCRFRGVATIGLHDLKKMKGNLLSYDVGIPSITPINSLDLTKKSILDIIASSTNTEVEKYKHLVENFEEFPYLRDDENIISVPPLINCNETKLTEETEDILVEVTSNEGEETTVLVLNSLLKQIYHLGLSLDHKKKFIWIEKGIVMRPDGSETLYPEHFVI